VPISFTLYLSNNFGCGLNFSIGDNINFFNARRLEYNDFSLNLKVLNKFGKIRNMFFIYEYGISVLGKCFIDLDNKIFNTSFFIGPDIFIGFEKQFKNFSLTIGANYSTMLAYYKTQSYSFSWNGTASNLFISPNINLEVRFCYLFVKDII